MLKKCVNCGGKWLRGRVFPAFFRIRLKRLITLSVSLLRRKLCPWGVTGTRNRARASEHRSESYQCRGDWFAYFLQYTHQAVGIEVPTLSIYSARFPRKGWTSWKKSNEEANFTTSGNIWGKHRPSLRQQSVHDMTRCSLQRSKLNAHILGWPLCQAYTAHFTEIRIIRWGEHPVVHSNWMQAVGLSSS